MRNLKLEVSADASTLNINVDSTDLPPFSTVQLQGLIECLIRCRAVMQPALPFRDLRPKDKVFQGERMRWWTGLVDGQQMLALLHPGLGWVGLRLSLEGVVELRDLLDEQLLLLAKVETPTIQ